MRPQSPSLLCSAWSEPKIKLSRQLFSMLFARAAELPIMTLFSFGLSNAPVFEHALLTQLALVASWVSARDVPGLRKLIAYRAARPIRFSGFWLLCHHSPRPALPPKLPPNFLGLGCNRQHKKRGPSPLRARASSQSGVTRHSAPLQLLDEHLFRSHGKLVVRNLDRIADVDNIRNKRSYKALQLLAPATVSENGCERCHLGLTLAPIKSLVLDEI
jgi:hypothetical protein